VGETGMVKAFWFVPSCNAERIWHGWTHTLSLCPAYTTQEDMAGAPSVTEMLPGGLVYIL